jgi:hypothetical protein
MKGKVHDKMWFNAIPLKFIRVGWVFQALFFVGRRVESGPTKIIVTPLQTT